MRNGGNVSMYELPAALRAKELLEKENAQLRSVAQRQAAQIKALREALKKKVAANV